MKRLVILLTLLSCIPVLAKSLYHESYHFISLDTGKVLISKNSKNNLTPASVTKLIIGAAALEHFGGSYQFKSPLLYTGKFKNSH